PVPLPAKTTCNGQPNIAWPKPTRPFFVYAVCAPQSKCTCKTCRSTTQRNFFRRIVTTRKKRPARKRCVVRSILYISATRWVSWRFSSCATITRPRRATNSHCHSSTTSCSTTACHPFASSAKSCSRTRVNGTRCCNFLFLLLISVLLLLFLVIVIVHDRLPV